MFLKHKTKRLRIKINLKFLHFSIPRFKQRVEFLTGQYGNLYNILDAGKVADSLLLLVSAEDGVDDFGEGCISCLLGQGMPAVTIVTQVNNGLVFPI